MDILFPYKNWELHREYCDIWYFSIKTIFCHSSKSAKKREGELVGLGGINMISMVLHSSPETCKCLKSLDLNSNTKFHIYFEKFRNSIFETLFNSLSKWICLKIWQDETLFSRQKWNLSKLKSTSYLPKKAKKCLVYRWKTCSGRYLLQGCIYLPDQRTTAYDSRTLSSEDITEAKWITQIL